MTGKRSTLMVGRPVLRGCGMGQHDGCPLRLSAAGYMDQAASLRESQVMSGRPNPIQATIANTAACARWQARGRLGHSQGQLLV